MSATAVLTGLVLFALVEAAAFVALLWWHGQVGEEQRVTRDEQDAKVVRLSEFERKLDRRHRKLYQDRELFDTEKADFLAWADQTRKERVAEGLLAEVHDIAAGHVHDEFCGDAPHLQLVDDPSGEAS